MKYFKEHEYNKTLKAFNKELKDKKKNQEENTKNDNDPIVVITDNSSNSDDNKEDKKIEKKSNKSIEKKKKEPSKKEEKQKDTKKEMKKEKKVEIEDNDDDNSEVSDTDVSDVSSVSTTDISSSEDEDDSDDSDDDSDSSEDEEMMKQHNLKKQKARAESREAAKKAADNWTPSKKITLATPFNTKNAGGTPFARVDSNFWADAAAKDGVENNTYENAFGNDGFGAKSSEKLLRVRGKDFRHEKTKRKRTFNGFSRTGGEINQESNSIKFNYNSD